MKKFEDDALILVGYLPSIRDFEIARMLGWYRIPLRASPKIIEVDYFAFYQGANFGEDHRWRIEYVACYKGHELTTRGELLRDERDHPRAREEYYKVQLGPIEKLPKPIIAEGWKRLTFLYSTGGMFNRATILNDLVIQDSDRDLVWKSLRERVRVGQDYKISNEADDVLQKELFNLVNLMNKDLEGKDLADY